MGLLPDGTPEPSNRKKGVHTHKHVAPPTGLFALPPAQPEYVEKDGLRCVVPYQSVIAAPCHVIGNGHLADKGTCL